MVEINADVGLNFFGLTDVLGYEHSFFAVNPNCVRIQLLAYLLYPSSYSRIDRLVFRPVTLRYLDVIGWILEVVHDWPNNIFVETQKLTQLLLCKVDGVAVLFCKHFVGLLLLNIVHCVFCDNNADPLKVIGLILS